MRLDIGIASWQAPEKLDRTIGNLCKHTQSDWRLLVVDNASPDPKVKDVIAKHAKADGRVIPRFMQENTGYAGAVNEILAWAESDYIVYCDNDAFVQTPGWDLKMAAYLDRNHELGMVFGRDYNSYEIQRRAYVEVMWGIGCFWMVKRLAYADVGPFDTSLGHQEEVDFQTRLRLAGWRLASAKDVVVVHEATASLSPAATERIGKGVIAWMNKWCAYFAGKGMTYHSENVLRFEDWPINAIYLEEWFKARLPNLNDDPEVITIEGREYDLIKVPRLKDYYRGRII